MNNNSTNNNLHSRKGEINFLLLGLMVIVGLLVVIIVYYVYTYSSSKKSSRPTQAHNSNTSNTSLQSTNNNVGGVPNRNTNNNVPGGMVPASTANQEQVFHVADNIFTYDDAEAVCKAYGADLADYQQMVDAYKQGANWCNYGWVKGQLALYPIQKQYWDKLQENDDEQVKGQCGVPGINGGYFENKNIQFGVNCFGVKRGPKGNEKEKNVYISDKERELQQKIITFRQQMGNLTLTPFNEEKWSSC